MAVRHYKELIVWQRGIDLVVASYKCTQRFPTHERFSLTQQLRRAAVSIPSNIAEGQGRFHRAEFLHHIAFARGSLQELETLLVIAARLGYVTAESLEEIWKLCEEVGRLLAGLRRALA
jgi:four helix bundle protein